MKESDDRSVIGLPAATTTEKALDISATIASFAPWIGGPVSSVLSGISTGRKMSRVNECLQELGKRIEAVHSDAAEKFVQTEDFEDLLEETLRRVALERNEEKRRLYGDFLVNNVAEPDFEYERRLKMLKVLEEIQMSHILVLRALAQPPTQREMDGMIGSVEDTLQGRASSVAGELGSIAKELERFDLATNVVNSMRVMMTASGAADLRRKVTPFGEQFMTFLTSDDGEADATVG